MESIDISLRDNYLVFSTLLMHKLITQISTESIIITKMLIP